MQLNKMRDTIFKQQIAIVIDGLTLLCTNQIRSHLFLYDRLGVRECLFIQQSHKAQERLCLTVVRCCRQEQQVWARLRQQVAQLISGHLAGGTGNTVGLIDDDKVPATVDDRIDAFLVIFFYTLICPASVFFDRLDRIHRRDNLVVLAIDIIRIRQASNGVVI